MIKKVAWLKLVAPSTWRSRSCNMGMDRTCKTKLGFYRRVIPVCICRTLAPFCVVKILVLSCLTIYHFLNLCENALYDGGEDMIR